MARSFFTAFPFVIRDPAVFCIAEATFALKPCSGFCASGLTAGYSCRTAQSQISPHGAGGQPSRSELFLYGAHSGIFPGAYCTLFISLLLFFPCRKGALWSISLPTCARSGGVCIGPHFVRRVFHLLLDSPWNPAAAFLLQKRYGRILLLAT